MSLPRSLLILAALVAAAAAPVSASAGLVPVAEKGAIVVIAGPVRGLDAPVTVRKGEAAWSQSVRPAMAVRLLDPVAERVRPHGKPIEAGQVLFGYVLSSGVAYCPPIPHDAAVPVVQCLRDFDDNSVFDGCYIGDTLGLHSHFAVGLVTDLVGCGKHRFEPADWDPKDGVQATILFKGFKKGVAVFQTRLEDQPLGVDYCVPEDGGLCAIMGMSLLIEPQPDDAVKITKLSSMDERQITIFTEGGPNLPNLEDRLRKRARR